MAVLKALIILCLFSSMESQPTTEDNPTSVDTSSTPNNRSRRGAPSPSPSSGCIESPKYPHNYPNNFDNIWIINAAGGHLIEVKFVTFSVEQGNSGICPYDWVQVRDGDGTILLPKSCGDTVPAPFTSKTNQVLVHFHTDLFITKKGWKLCWKSTADEFKGQCYVDNPSRLLGHYFLLPGITPERCVQYCKRVIGKGPAGQIGYNIAGVEAGFACFCGDCIAGTLIEIPTTQCNSKCLGDPNKFCGGIWTMNLYSTGI